MNNPEKISEVTPAWLSKCLDMQIEAFDPQPLPSGYMSDVYRVRVTVQAGDDFTFILKLAASAADRRSDAQAFSSYEKEVHFYNQLKPLVERAGIKTPKCYFSRLDAAGNPAIGLEDLSSLGVVPETLGCSLAQARATLAALAGLNSGGFLNAATAATIEIPDFQSGFDPATRYLAATQLYPFKAEGLGKDLLQHYMAASVTFLPAFLQQTQVVSHMDCRLANLRFKDDEPVLFDWGEFSYAPIGFDVASFMVTSLTAQHCADWEANLLEAYLAAVHMAGMREITLETLQRGYRLSLLPLVYLPLLIRGRGDADFAGLLFSRLTAAMKRHEQALSDDINQFVG